MTKACLFLIVAYLLVSSAVRAGELSSDQKNAPPVAEYRAPNVVLLVADDLGYGELVRQDAERIPTPNIDRLTQLGATFSNGYVTAPNCSPSRAGLLTGRIQTRFGYEFNPIGARNEDPGRGLPLEEITIASRLQKLGYATGMFGKWHLGGTADFHPMRRGFDEFTGFLHEGHYFVPPPYRGVQTWLRRKNLPPGTKSPFVTGDRIWSSHMGHDEPPYDANNPILRGSQPVAEYDYLTDLWTRESLDFIDRHRGQPFFLYVPYNAVHSPMQATHEDLAKFAHIENVQRRIFAGMLHRLDQSVGAILDRLDQLELADHTLVIFISDNGGPTRELTSSNHPLRGEKGTMYEGGVRVPWLMRLPGRIKPGIEVDQPVWTPDLTPTILKLAGGDPQLEEFDGVDLLTSLNHPDQSRTFYWRQGSRAALRSGDWKIVGQLDRPEDRRWELFNLSRDLSETNNLANTEPQKLAEMTGLWESLNKQMKPAL